MRAKVEIQFFDVRAKEPEYATQGSAGLDLRACYNGSIYPGETMPFSMGYGIYIKDPTICGLIVPRSGLGVKGILPANVVGLIDSDYQGELIVHLKNHGEEKFIVTEGDRIAQLVLMPVFHAQFTEVDDWSVKTKRGEGGFGSTGND